MKQINRTARSLLARAARSGYGFPNSPWKSTRESVVDSARQAPWVRRTADYAALKDVPRILDKDTAARFPPNKYTLSSSYYRRRRKSDGTYILGYDDEVAIWYACLSLCAYHHTLTMHMLFSAPGTGK